MPPKKDGAGTPGPKTDKTARNGVNALPPRDEHISVNNFNGREVKAELAKASQAKATAYKPPKTDTATARPGNAPWGIKGLSYLLPPCCTVHPAMLTFLLANTMANGKDFFLELRKQVSAAQKAGGTTLGG